MTISGAAQMVTLVVVASAAARLVAQEPLEVKRVRVDGTDIADMTGLDIYKYEVKVKKGQTITVSLDVQMEETSEPVKYIAHKAVASQDGPATLTACFLRSDRKLASVFLSTEERMEFRIQLDGAANGGLSGFIKNPLGEIPIGQKAL